MDARRMEYGSIDAISLLPDDILAQIVCLLPTKRAASTLILSKRWRNLFTFVVRHYTSHLEFDDSDFLYPNRQRSDDVRESFSAHVDSTLSRCLQQQDGTNSSSIKKLSLKRRDDLGHFTAHTSRLISKALQLGVSDLDLHITIPVVSDPHLYDSLFSFIVFPSNTNTLVKLTLGTSFCLGYVPRSEFRLPVLKSLSLYTVWFTGCDFSDYVVSRCPMLEELYIQHKYVDHPGWTGPYYIFNENVKRITIHLDYRRHCDVPLRSFTFYTPNLVYLDYSDRIDKRLFRFANFVDSLVEARLDLILKMIRYSYLGFAMFKPFTSLLVMWQCLGYWRDNGGFPLFSNLVNLSFECKTKYGWNVLWSLIKNSPKLETLILKSFGCVRNCKVGIDGNLVKVLEIYGYRGTGREWSQVKFLCEMEFLEVMKVEVDAKIDAYKKLQFTRDLLALPKSSSKCEIQFL